MADQEIHVGDIGTVFEITAVDSGAVVDISTKITLQILLKKPDNTVLTKTAIFTSDGTDGKFQYTAVIDDLNMAGIWKIQGVISLPAWSGSTATGEFEVFSTLG